MTSSYQLPQELVCPFVSFLYPSNLKLELELSDRIPITTRKYEDLSKVDHGP